MASKAKVFNNRKRRVYRSQVPSGEVVVGVVVLCVLVAAGAWFALKRGDFDPAERDISMAALINDSVVDTMYRTPLRPWADPSVPQAAAGPDLGIFPPGITDGGWQPSSRLQRFNPDTLYEKINGAADQFLQFGFEELHYVSLQRAEFGEELSVELYDMGNLPNALGIFVAQKDRGKATESMNQARYYPTEAGAMALISPYYLRLAGNDSSPDIRDKAQQIVGAISAGVASEAQPPRPYAVLTDVLAIPFDALAYERSNVFQFDFAEDFWFGQPEADSDLRYYLHEATGAAEATALYAKLLENNLFDYTLVEQWEEGAILEHRFLKTFAAMQHQNGLVLGVEHAKDQKTLETALDTLLGALVDEETES